MANAAGAANTGDHHDHPATGPALRLQRTDRRSPRPPHGRPPTVSPITAGGSTSASTNYYYHTLGYTNDSAENWDYFAFNDRDFTSVAELMLVPGCPPGLFTKQFVEFAPSQMNAADHLQPGHAGPHAELHIAGHEWHGHRAQLASKPGDRQVPGRAVQYGDRAVPVGLGGDGDQHSRCRTTRRRLHYRRRSQPSRRAAETADGESQRRRSSPIRYPYLVDKFFYTGASTFLYPPQVPPNTATGLGPLQSQNTITVCRDFGTTDPSAFSEPVVGGPAADGWFKMFEFFEVPSQMNGAIGPVAGGSTSTGRGRIPSRA